MARSTEAIRSCLIDYLEEISPSPVQFLFSLRRLGYLNHCALMKQFDEEWKSLQERLGPEEWLEVKELLFPAEPYDLKVIPKLALLGLLPPDRDSRIIQDIGIARILETLIIYISFHRVFSGEEKQTLFQSLTAFQKIYRKLLEVHEWIGNKDQISLAWFGMDFDSLKKEAAYRDNFPKAPGLLTGNPSGQDQQERLGVAVRGRLRSRFSDAHLPFDQFEKNRSAASAQESRR